MRVPLHLLPLEIDHDADVWVIADRWTLVYGDGTTFWHALWDYLVSLRDWWQLRPAARWRQEAPGGERGDGQRQHP